LFKSPGKLKQKFPKDNLWK